MGTKRPTNTSAYGFDNALQNVSQPTIISQRVPTAADFAEKGTMWVNELTNAYYVLTSIAAGAAVWTPQITGAGTFAAVAVTGAVGTTLTVTADSALTGDLSVGGDTTMTGKLTVTGDFVANGDFDISGASAYSFTSTANAAKSLYLHANGGVLETIDLTSTQGTGVNAITLLATAGGIQANANLASNDAINLIAGAGGVKIDAVLMSAINVIGAGQDIQLNATGGSIAVTATEASATAVNITASNAAGKVAIAGAGGLVLSSTNSAISVQPGTGALNLATAAAVNVTTIGNTAGASRVVINTGTAGCAITTTNGTLGLVSGTGAINIGADAAAKTITIGNVTAATGVVVNSGTNGIAMASTGAGDITLTSADTVLIDAAGVLELNSSAGVIGIGNDAVAQNINIGTGAAARDITVGNISTTSSFTLDVGTGDCRIGASVTAHDTIIGSTTATCTLTLNTPAGTMVEATNGVQVVTAGAGIELPGGLLILSGAGTPNGTITAPLGSLYLRSDGSGVANRLYVNTNSAVAWTNFVSAA